MAGLLNRDDPETKRTADMGGQADEAGMPADGEPAPPEEQKAYDAFVANGMEMLYDEKAMPQVIESIKGDGDPVAGLANAVVMLVTRLEDSARQSGQEIPPDVTYHGSIELMEQMADLAGRAKVHDYSEEEMESALYQALDLYRGMAQEKGTLPVDQLKQDMQGLMQAEQQGQLENLLPGITEFAQKRAPQPAAKG